MRTVVAALLVCLITCAAHSQDTVGRPVVSLDDCDTAVIARASDSRQPVNDPAFAKLVYNVRAWAGTPVAAAKPLTPGTFAEVIDDIGESPGQLVRTTVQILRVDPAGGPSSAKTAAEGQAFSDVYRWTVRLLPAARGETLKSGDRLSLDHPPLDPADVIAHLYVVKGGRYYDPGDVWHLTARVYRAPGPAYRPAYVNSPRYPQVEPPSKARLELVAYAPGPTLDRVSRRHARSPIQQEPDDSSGDSDDALKAVSFNIRYGTAKDGPNAWPHRREMVTDLLRDMDADVIGLQEALRFQLDEIEAALPGYIEVGVGRDDGLTAGEYAPLLVRSRRFAVAAAGTFWLSDTPEVPGSRSWGNGIPRICTWARLVEKAGAEDHARAVWVYNVHMDHISAASRQRGAELIAAYLRDRPAAYADEPVVLMGDFNTGEGSPPLQFLRGEADRASSEEMWPGYESPESPALVDTFRQAHPDAEEVGTFTAFRMGATTGEKIDHILVSQGARVLDAGIDRTSRDGRYPSDHFPVWAVVKF